MTTFLVTWSNGSSRVCNADELRRLADKPQDVRVISASGSQAHPAAMLEWEQAGAAAMLKWKEWKEGK